MRVVTFRVSGDDFTGEAAEAAYRAAHPFGFDCVSLTSDLRGIRGSPVPEHTILADVSGVAAWVELGFDTADEMMAWAKDARLVEPFEPNATAAYKAIRAAVDAIAPGPDCTHSALDACDCFATPASGGPRDG